VRSVVRSPDAAENQSVLQGKHNKIATEDKDYGAFCLHSSAMLHFAQWVDFACGSDSFKQFLKTILFSLY